MISSWEATRLSTHLVAAFVDNCVARTLDADGYLSDPDSVEVTRRPDRPDNLGPMLSLPVNYGASYDCEVGLGDRMVEAPRDDRPERLTYDAIRALMRHPVGGEDGPLSGSGGGRRRTKPPKRLATNDPPGRAVGGYVSSFQVSGLTRGELDFYDRRPGVDVAVLHDFVARVILDPSIHELRGAAPRSERPLIVFEDDNPEYGLSEPKLQILRHFRNRARIALSEYARANDAGRIAAIDGASAPTRPASSKRTYEHISSTM